MYKLTFRATICNPGTEEEKDIHIVIIDEDPGTYIQNDFKKAVDMVCDRIDELEDSWEWVLSKIEWTGGEKIDA